MVSLPESIYHYTDAAGLLGILQKGQFWATSVHSLNDRGEYVAGRQQTIDSLIRTRESEKYPTADPMYLESKFDEGDMLDEIFVISLTSLKDNVNLWRGYGGEFALEFDRAALASYLVFERNVNSKLAYVSYDDSDGVIHDAIVAQLQDAEDRGQIANNLVALMLQAALHKSRNWESEAEIRWVGVAHLHNLERPNDFAKARGGRFGLRRYIEVPASENCVPYLPGILRSVTVGPGTRQAENVQTLERISGRFINGPGFEVHRSSVELR